MENHFTSGVTGIFPNAETGVYDVECLILVNGQPFNRFRVSLSEEQDKKLKKVIKPIKNDLEEYIVKMKEQSLKSFKIPQKEIILAEKKIKIEKK